MLFNRYKIIEVLKHKSTQFYYQEPNLWRCLDLWSGKIVALKHLRCFQAYDVAHCIQKSRGLMIASDLQLQSDNFLQIHDISFCTVPKLGKGYLINTEYMGKHHNIIRNFRFSDSIDFVDQTLTDAILSKKMSFDDKIRIFYKIVKALSEMEDAGIVHTNLNVRSNFYFI